jgi:hypothetical protein
MAHYAAYLVVGLAAGFTSALLGIGGGVIMVPALIFFFSLPAKEATVTSLAYICPVALAGALLGAHRSFQIHWLLVALAVPAGLVGAHLGTHAKAHISAAQLKLVFGLLMIVVGARLALAPWTGGREPDSAPSGLTAAEELGEPPADVTR